MQPTRTFSNIILLSSLSVWLIACVGSGSGAGTATNTYSIGQPGPAGGIVFYVTDGGAHGLEAAPVDQSNSRWGCDDMPITGADGTTVGAGEQNTTSILAACNEPGIAAALSDSYILNGYSDWFLPSRDELTLMFLNIGPGSTSIGNVGGFATSWYWSSSESHSKAWYVDFGSSTVFGYVVSKASSNSVRAARAF